MFGTVTIKPRLRAALETQHITPEMFTREETGRSSMYFAPMLDGAEPMTASVLVAACAMVGIDEQALMLQVESEGVDRHQRAERLAELIEEALR